VRDTSTNVKSGALRLAELHVWCVDGTNVHTGARTGLALHVTHTRLPYPAQLTFAGAAVAWAHLPFAGVAAAPVS
jgi:hypothetical protein